MYTQSISTGPSMVDNGLKIRILVVDDDATCLVVIAARLKIYQYQVATASNPLEALSTLRMNPEYFDLVLSDVHMPYMSGLELHKIIDKEFHIPVILISADERRSLALEGLSNGAAFFIFKPPNANALKNLWQYVVSRKKGKYFAISAEKNSNSPVLGSASSLGSPCDRPFINPTTPSSLVGERLILDYFPKRKAEEDNEDVKITNNEERNFPLANRKKPKLIWTTALHNKFLEAIRVIGPTRAVPKKILEYMNIPGLTRENIASHLQKYRIYLRRSYEDQANGSLQNVMLMPYNLLNDYRFGSNFSWSQFSPLPNNNYLMNYPSNYTMPSNNNIHLANQAFPGFNQAQGTLMNWPNYNLVHQPHPPTANATPAFARPNPPPPYQPSAASEITILESSMLVGQTSNTKTTSTNTTNATNTGNARQGGVVGNNQGDHIGNNAGLMQYYSAYKLNMVPNVHEDQTETKVGLGNNAGGSNAELSAFVPNSNAMIDQSAPMETNFNGGVEQGIAPQQEAYRVPAPTENSPNDHPQQEMRNFDVSNISTGSTSQFQEWAAKNLDDFSLDGIDDLSTFLSTYDGNNGSNNHQP